MVTRDLIAAVTRGLSVDRKLFEATAEAVRESVRKLVAKRFAHHPGRKVEVLGVSDDGTVRVKVTIPVLFPSAEREASEVDR